MAAAVESSVETALVEPASTEVKTDTPLAESPMYYNFWYRAARTSDIRRGKMMATTMLETRVLVGRDRAGRAFAMKDACPHRGTPLSYGWFNGEQVQCVYHGWKFDVNSGQCQGIPSCAQGQDLHHERIFAPRLECEERDGYIWVYIPEPSGRLAKRALTPAGPAPVMPMHSEKYKSFQLTSHVETSGDHARTSLMDPSHGPFVHARWWWFARLLLLIRPDGGEKAVVRDMERDFTPLPNGFRETTTQPITEGWFRKQSGSDVATVAADYVMPYSRVAVIRAGKYWVTGFATVTPVTKSTSRIDVRLAWNIYLWFPFGAAILKYIFWVFFEQDRLVMKRQAEGLKSEPRLMAVDDADRQLRWFHEIKRAFFAAKKAGREFENPVKQPVKLRWRATDYRDILR